MDTESVSYWSADVISRTFGSANGRAFPVLASQFVTVFDTYVVQTTVGSSKRQTFSVKCS